MEFGIVEKFCFFQLSFRKTNVVLQSLATLGQFGKTGVLSVFVMFLNIVLISPKMFGNCGERGTC